MQRPRDDLPYSSRKPIQGPDIVPGSEGSNGLAIIPMVVINWRPIPSPNITEVEGTYVGSAMPGHTVNFSGTCRNRAKPINQAY